VKLKFKLQRRSLTFSYRDPKPAAGDQFA